MDTKTFFGNIAIKASAGTGKTYRLSVWAKSSSDSTGTLRIDSTEGAVYIDIPSNSPTWTQYTYDFTEDANAIHADFMREYHIDLTTADMHWWRFMALLDGLISPTFTRRVEIRTKDLSGMKSKERAQWLKARNAFAINQGGGSYEDHIAELDDIIARHGGDTFG